MRICCLNCLQRRVRFDRRHQLHLEVVQAHLLAPFEFGRRVLQRLLVGPHRHALAEIVPSLMRVVPGSGLEMSRPPPCHDARIHAGALAAQDRGLERHVEILRDAAPLHRRHRTQQPHQQEERHHRGHEVRVGELPRAAVMPLAAPDHALDEDRTVFVVAHPGAFVVTQPAARVTFALTRRTCSSSSENDGRSVENSTLRPNSTAMAGA